MQFVWKRGHSLEQFGVVGWCGGDWVLQNAWSGTRMINTNAHDEDGLVLNECLCARGRIHVDACTWMMKRLPLVNAMMNESNNFNFCSTHGRGQDMANNRCAIATCATTAPRPLSSSDLIKVIEVCWAELPGHHMSVSRSFRQLGNGLSFGVAVAWHSMEYAGPSSPVALSGCECPLARHSL
jgi:hypothetical protein